MLRASSDAAGDALGAAIRYADVPLFDGAGDYLAQGLCPTGTRRNLDFAASHVRFAPGLDENRRLLLADAQTSGGLLIAVPEDGLDGLLVALDDEGVTIRAVIGRVSDADMPGSIEVS